MFILSFPRPPGHHAMKDEPNGYCYYNNAAVVARKAIAKYNLKRILIVDWDVNIKNNFNIAHIYKQLIFKLTTKVHHGQASQFEFYDDPRLF